MDEKSNQTGQIGSKDLLLDALYRITELSSDSPDQVSFFPVLHRIVASLLPAKNFYIALYHSPDDSIELVYLVDEHDDTSPSDISSELLHRGLTGYLLRTGDPLLLDPEKFRALVEQGQVEDIGADSIDWLGIPLKRQEQVIGAMVVQSYDADTRYSEADKALLGFVARHVVSALERMRARELLEQQIQERTLALTRANSQLRQEIEERQRAETIQSVMFRLSELANSTDDMADFLGQVHQEIGRLLDADNFYVAMLSQDRQTLTFPYFVDETGYCPLPRPPGKGLTEYVMRQRKPLLLNSKCRRHLIRQGELCPSGREAKQWLGCPLVIDDTVVGALVVQCYDDSHRYRQDDIELLQFICRHVSAALARRRAHQALEQARKDLKAKVRQRTLELERANEELRHQIEAKQALANRHRHDALHDSLTGLANRAYFTSQLDRVLKQLRRYPNRRYAVAFIDLDKFKLINDSLGHLVGDELLKQVSERLASCIRETDMLARLGGDEFVILLDCMQHDHDAEVVTGRISQIMQQPFEINGKPLFSGCSIGLAHCHHRYQDAADVLRDADTAMYQAKAKGRGQLVVFDDDMRKSLVSRFSLQNALRQAIAQEQIFPMFQPVFSLRHQCLYGFESLARWERAGGGNLTPEIFLDVAEESGLIVDIDRLMLGHACRQLGVWSHQRASQPVYISVNLSARTLATEGFVDWLRALLDQHELRPQQLQLEVRESTLIAANQAVEKALAELSELQVGLILDSFGTGSASLSLLMKYQFSALKLSPAFIRQLTDRQQGDTLLQSVLAMSKHLGTPIIAHGIESAEQQDYLRALGFHFGQGNHLCQPLRLSQAEMMLCA
ncbi:EAL domain-containing protein [Gallaecimonas sp. GXIMD4217]|uniref:EAL domain-containing protein n=1 Tax=Gallaecimonas sp. GXIMD4217 TaxID=3131927 RepID=UPI00311AFC7B